MPSPNALLQRMYNVPSEVMVLSADGAIFTPEEEGVITCINLQTSAAVTANFTGGTAAGEPAIFTLSTASSAQFTIPLPHPFVVPRGQGLFLDFTVGTCTIHIFYRKM